MHRLTRAFPIFALLDQLIAIEAYDSNSLSLLVVHQRLLGPLIGLLSSQDTMSIIRGATEGSEVSLRVRGPALRQVLLGRELLAV